MTWRSSASRSPYVAAPRFGRHDKRSGPAWPRWPRVPQVADSTMNSQAAVGIGLAIRRHRARGASAGNAPRRITGIGNPSNAEPRASLVRSPKPAAHRVGNRAAELAESRAHPLPSEHLPSRLASQEAHHAVGCSLALASSRSSGQRTHRSGPIANTAGTAIPAIWRGL